MKINLWNISFLFIFCFQVFAEEHKYSRNLIPLPVYSTLPNEGSTWGFMPVFMKVEDNTQFTKSIIAPSVSWNRIIQFTGTYRGFYYPSPIDTITFVPSFSTKVNRNVTLNYFHQTREKNKITIESINRYRRTIFSRFFGEGNTSKVGNETSYTKLGGDSTQRIGINITPELNIAGVLGFQRHIAEQKSVDFLPLTHSKFPQTKGLSGSTVITSGISIRYDTRPNREFSDSGSFTEFSSQYFAGLADTNGFLRNTIETKGIWKETSFLQGAARAYWSYTGGDSSVPFFYKPSLGGSFYLRGFTEDRFIDKGAWEIEIEQRITLFQMHIYGVTSDWRLDPFFALGNVYSGSSDFLKNLKPSGGLGFRTHVKPNVVGRVDTAVGGEGIKVYVELGHPF